MHLLCIGYPVITLVIQWYPMSMASRNSTMRDLDEVSITLIVLALPICVVNLIFVILLYRRESLGNLQNALLFSLGCSDFCAGFFVIPFILLCTQITSQCMLCIASYLFNRFVMILSLLHLTAVVFERYLKIVHPFWFQKKQYTLLQSRRIVPVLWATSLLIAASPLTWWPLRTPCTGSETLTRNVENFDSACLALFCTLLLFMVYTFVRLFLVVRYHLRDINITAVQLRASTDTMLNHSTESSCNSLPPTSQKNYSKHDVCSSPSNNRSAGNGSEFLHASTQTLRRQLLKKEAKILVRFASMVFMFLLVWGAYFYLSFLEKEKGDVSKIAENIQLVVRFINPLLDPWILTVKNKYWRESNNSLRRCRNVIFRGLWKCSSATRGHAHQATAKQGEIQIRAENTNGAVSNF